MKRTVQSCFLSAWAALMGLMAVLFLGHFWWLLGSGVQGIAVGTVVAGGLAWLMRLRFGLITSVVASMFGAAVACYLAIASAEILPPGSFQWMQEGGRYGARAGLPLAFLLGPLGLLEVGAIHSQSTSQVGNNE